MSDLLKGVALVYTLIKKLTEQNPNIQIGKTVIQKMMYLLERERNYDFGFSMYHYGPYSIKVSSYLNFAENIGGINIKWFPEKGYFIEPRNLEEIETFEKSLDEKDQEAIEKIVSIYGKLEPIAIKLSIIATAIYVRENFGVSQEHELIKIIGTLKPQHSLDYIRQVLQEADVI